MSGLAGRSLLVVGGGSGIGLAAVQIAAQAGARVLVADIDAEAAERVAEIDGDATFRRCDARDTVDAAAAVGATIERHGRLDGLFTTVGGAHLGGLDELTSDGWEEEIRFNLTSAFAVCRAAVPVLRNQRGGAIVTTSSGYAAMPGPDRPAYVAAKAGVIAFTRSLAATLAPHRARANCIAPGPTDTARFRAMNGGDAGVEAVRARMPMGEIPTPEDCAQVALFLLSDEARALTGQTIHVNGGLLMA